MDRIVSRRKQMAESVCVFSDTHPSADPNAAGVVTRLKAAVARITELGGLQKGGFLSLRASTARRTQLRRTIRNNLLRHLVTVAGVAAREKAALLGMFEVPNANLSHARFENDARKMLDQGRAERDLLVKHGLSTTLLEDLAAALDEFNALGPRNHHRTPGSRPGQRRAEAGQRGDPGAGGSAGWDESLPVQGSAGAAGRLEIRPARRHRPAGCERRGPSRSRAQGRERSSRPPDAPALLRHSGEGLLPPGPAGPRGGAASFLRDGRRRPWRARVEVARGRMLPRRRAIRRWRRAAGSGSSSVWNNLSQIGPLVTRSGPDGRGGVEGYSWSSRHNA